VAHKLLLATNNPGKVDEYRTLLEGLPLAMTTPAEEGLASGPEESGATFEENALVKARYYGGASGILALADDSGLEVDALNGEPGVHSARYAGDGATDAELVRFLLAKLEDIPWQRRIARFRCVIALVWPGGAEETFHGSREGYITTEPKGRNGFGYDPVFYVPELGKTFAQVEPEVKNRLSHRAEAARKVVQRLRREVETVPAS